MLCSHLLFDVEVSLRRKVFAYRGRTVWSEQHSFPNLTYFSTPPRTKKAILPALLKERKGEGREGRKEKREKERKYHFRWILDAGLGK